MGQIKGGKGKGGSTFAKLKKGAEKLLGKGGGGGRRRRQTIASLQNKIIKLKLKKKLARLQYGGR